MRSVDWVNDHLEAWDQTQLPETWSRMSLNSVADVVSAISRLKIRGAPAIGAAGAYGVALAAHLSDLDGYQPERVRKDAALISGARPTAVNLSWAVSSILPYLDDGPVAVAKAATDLVDAEAAREWRLVNAGAGFVAAEVGRPQLRIHTHCNTGPLACVEAGTAGGIINTLHRAGLVGLVTVSETRPLLQGARLTAAELEMAGIPHRLSTDGGGVAGIMSGQVDVVIVGADRIAANGDVANKVGTLALALAAKRANIPFVVAAPESTIDARTRHGDEIHVELRSESEVTEFRGTRISPSGTRAYNPAFDVTPHDLVTAIVTDRRVVSGVEVDLGVPFKIEQGYGLTFQSTSRVG